MADSQSFRAELAGVREQLVQLAVTHDVGVLLILVHEDGSSHQVSNFDDDSVRAVAKVFAEGAGYLPDLTPQVKGQR